MIKANIGVKVKTMANNKLKHCQHIVGSNVVAAIWHSFSLTYLNNKSYFQQTISSFFSKLYHQKYVINFEAIVITKSKVCIHFGRAERVIYMTIDMNINWASLSCTTFKFLYFGSMRFTEFKFCGHV